PLVAVFLFAAVPFALRAQNPPFNSGSTGAMGAFTMSENQTLNVPPDGVFHYTTITISGGVLSFNRNAANTPVYLLARGDVMINGWISVSGSSAMHSAQFYGVGGPGGFDGGMAGTGGTAPTAGGDGKGPGGGSHGVVGGTNANDLFTNGSGSYSTR